MPFTAILTLFFNTLSQVCTTLTWAGLYVKDPPYAFIFAAKNLGHRHF